MIWALGFPVTSWEAAFPGCGEVCTCPQLCESAGLFNHPQTEKCEFFFFFSKRFFEISWLSGGVNDHPHGNNTQKIML